jgi:hypothetical protein
MSQDLLDHPVCVDETRDLHQSTTMATKKRTHLPEFFTAFMPEQKRDYHRRSVPADVCANENEPRENSQAKRRRNGRYSSPNSHVLFSHTPF